MQIKNFIDYEVGENIQSIHLTVNELSMNNHTSETSRNIVPNVLLLSWRYRLERRSGPLAFRQRQLRCLVISKSSYEKADNEYLDDGNHPNDCTEFVV